MDALLDNETLPQPSSFPSPTDLKLAERLAKRQLRHLLEKKNKTSSGEYREEVWSSLTARALEAALSASEAMAEAQAGAEHSPSPPPNEAQNALDLALADIQHPLPQHGKATRLQSALFGERDPSISKDEILDALLSNETLPQPPSFPHRGEFPIAEGKCPFEECGIEPVNNPSVDSAHHIHQHVKRAFAGLARAAYAATVDLDECLFGGCGRGE